MQLIGTFELGGSERQALQLARLLKETGRYDVRLVCSQRRGVLQKEAEDWFGDIPEYPLTSFYNARAIDQVRRFANELRRERVSIIQTHDFYTNVFGMAAAALARVPVRIAARRETGGVRNRAQKVAERCAYRLAHAIVVNAVAVGDQLAKEGVPQTKIVAVHNSVDLNRVASPGGRSAALTRLGLSHDAQRRFVSIVANMRYPVKDHAMFLRAARIVATAQPAAAFLLAGEGSLIEPLRNLAAELGLADRTIFLGRCEHIGDVLSISDVCVLTSLYEGFPNVVLEYMAAGKPVVSTDVGGVREAIIEGETGHLVPPGNADLTAARIIALLSDPENARLIGARGRAVVEQRFSCQAQLSRTEALYHKLLNKRIA